MKNILKKLKKGLIATALTASTAYFGYLGYINPSFKTELQIINNITKKIDEKKALIASLLGMSAFPYLLAKLTKKNKPEDLAYYALLNTSVILNILDLCCQGKGIEIEATRHVYLPATFFIPVSYYMLTNDLQGYHPPQIKNYFKAKYMAYKITKEINDDTPPETLLKIIEELKKIHKKPALIEMSYYHAYMKAEDYEKAMQHYFNALKQFAEEKEKQNIYAQIVHKIAIPIAEKFKPNQLDPFSYLLSADASKAIQFFEREKPTIREICAGANTLEIIAENHEYFKKTEKNFPSKKECKEKAKKQWKKATEEIDKQKRNIKSVKENNVFIVDPKDSPYLSNFFIFKKIDKTQKDLTEADEIEITNEEFGVGERITECGFEGQKYCVYRLKEGKLLIEGTLEDYLKTARYLAKIHRKIRSEKKRNYFEILEQRICLEIYEGIRDGIAREIKQIIMALDGDDVFDKDATAKNWIVSKEGKIIAIDLENKGNINQYRDLVKLTESGKRESMDEKWNILEAYFSAYGKQLCRKSHLTASLLEPINSYYFLNDFNKEMLQNYLANAGRNLEEIRKENKDAFINIEKACKRLKNHGLKLVG